MRRMLITLVSALALLGFTASSALADANFKSDPTYWLSNYGMTANVTAMLSGLGNGKYTAQLDVYGSASYNCYNKGNNLPAPHSPQFYQTPGTPVTFYADHNGIGSFNTSTTFDPPATLTGQDAVTLGCPNRNWTGMLTSARILSATLTITGGPPTFFYSGTYTFLVACAVL